MRTHAPPTVSTAAAIERPVAGEVTLRRVLTTWWPLAASWIFMGLELPMVSAVMARLPDPEINLAAYGGIVFPLSLLIEAPVIMLLAASTARSRSWPAYVELRRFALGLGLSLSTLHGIVAFTPLYDLAVTGLIGAPEEIVEPGRLGLRLVTPWTFAIAVRRFHQGVLIRAGRSRSVGLGTSVRLATYALTLWIGHTWSPLPGVALAALGASVAVSAEALVVKIRVEPVLRRMRAAAVSAPRPGTEPLGLRGLVGFYLPLAVTPILTLVSLPIVSASLSRMPMAIESLAVWPVLTGLTFTLRSLGIAYNEVVIALIDEKGAPPVLRRFAGTLAVSTTGLLALIAATPLAALWFEGVSGLAPDLATLGRRALLIVILFPAVSVFQSVYQAIIVHSQNTRGVTEAVALQLAVGTAILLAGVRAETLAGLFVGVTANFAGNLAQLAWLRVRSRSVEHPK